MDDLIKEALTAEAAEVPFPAAAWERQQGLLAAEGLLGGAPSKPVAPARRRALLWGELVAVAALLVLTLGLGLWGRPSPQQAVGGESPQFGTESPQAGSDSPGSVTVPTEGGPAGGATSRDDLTELQAEIRERALLAQQRVVETERLLRLLAAQQRERIDLTDFPHLAPELWSLSSEMVVGLRPVEGRGLEDDPRYPFAAQIDQIAPRLLDWVAEAGVVNVQAPAGVVAQPVFYLDLADGGYLWFGLYNACLVAERPNCPLVVGGTGRHSTQIVHPDLWRWLEGRAWQQPLFGADWSPASRDPWTGPLHLSEEGLRTQMNADPLVVAAGLSVERIMVQPRYIERLDADGKWRMYETPLWIIYLRPIEPTGLHGRIRHVDDLTGEMLWDQPTTLAPNR